MTDSDWTFRSDMTVLLANSMGDDLSICQNARVEHPELLSQRETTLQLLDKDKGLLNMLVRDRHGSPIESVVFRFYIEAPIFVARESHRHRIASINEASSRYKVLEPVFYIPSEDRNLTQVGNPGAYTFGPGNDLQVLTTNGEHVRQAKYAWAGYQAMLNAGVAREVARNILPLSVYTSWYLTINLRSLLNFLSLRRVTDDTTVPTFPLREIEMIAEQMEHHAERIAPETMRLFREHGRRGV